MDDVGSLELKTSKRMQRAGENYVHVCGLSVLSGAWI